MKTVITNATIVYYDKIIEAEISIEQGLITEVNSTVCKDGATIIDAKDCYVLPGAVDIHTRLACGADGKVDREAYKQNSLASLYGGTTTVIEEIDNNYVHENFLMEYDNLLKDNSYIDYSLHQSIKNKLDEEDFNTIKKNAVSGFPSVYMSTYGEKYQNDEDILKVAKELSLYGATSFVSCESHVPIKLLEELHTLKNRIAPYAIASTRPAFTESEAFNRMSNLARAGNISLCADNISTKEVVKMLYEQVHEGLPISVSVNPLHLLFTEDVYKTTKAEDLNTYKYLIHPPLRKKEDIEALWNAISSGLIHFVSSNHNATHLDYKVKSASGNVLKSPAGVPSVELRLALLYTFGVLTNRIDMKKLVEITATHVTRIAGLRSKGRIDAGTDADIIIFDPNCKKVITKEILHESADYTPYENMELQGFAKHVFLRGKHVIENYTLTDTAANGKIVMRKPIAMH